jgi:hypothetical protein
MPAASDVRFSGRDRGISRLEAVNAGRPLLTDSVDKVDDETAGALVLRFCRSVARLLGGDDIVLAIDVDVDATNAQAR